MAESGQLDAVFHALSHDTRRTMLARLADGSLSVGELAAPLPMSLAAASKHVQVLERAGLIERTILGRRHEFRVLQAQLDEGARWLAGMAVPPELDVTPERDTESGARPAEPATSAKAKSPDTPQRPKPKPDKPKPGKLKSGKAKRGKPKAKQSKRKGKRA